MTDLDTELTTIVRQYVKARAKDPAYDASGAGPDYVPTLDEVLRLEEQMVAAVRRYVRVFINKQYPRINAELREDAVPIALMAAVSALRGYRQQLGRRVKFITWATANILRALRDPLCNSDGLNYRFRDALKMADDFASAYHQAYDAWPDEDAIAKAVGVTPVFLKSARERAAWRGHGIDPTARQEYDWCPTATFNIAFDQVVLDLPPQEQEVIYLCLLGEMTTHEAASMLQQHPHKVWDALRRVREHLNRELIQCRMDRAA